MSAQLSRQSKASTIFVAAATSAIGLATGVLLLPEHNPVVAAKQAATLDVLSAGRLTLGLGIGWSAEEFAALGIGWQPSQTAGRASTSPSARSRSGSRSWPGSANSTIATPAT